MKNLVSVLVALGLAIGFAGAAFAADAPKTKADCEKAESQAGRHGKELLESVKLLKPRQNLKGRRLRSAPLHGRLLRSPSSQRHTT